MALIFSILFCLISFDMFIFSTFQGVIDIFFLIDIF